MCKTKDREWHSKRDRMQERERGSRRFISFLICASRRRHKKKTINTEVEQ